MKSKFFIGIKFLFQLGLRPLVQYALYKFGLLTGHYRRLTPIIDGRDSNIKLSNTVSLFPLPDRERLIQILGEEGKAILLKETDEVMDGLFRMFGGEPAEIKFTGDWPSVHWTDFERGKIDLRPSIFDIKYIWEPARFGWSFTLGRAYHLTHDNNYAESFWKYFESFTESNPANMGPHWMNGQEVAIRLISLVWADHVFENAPASSHERRAVLHQSIAHHASRIAPTLVYARAQNNNHLVTESAALYTAGLFFKNKKWRAIGWKWLNWSYQNQIGDYGEYIQHSTNYHRVMLQTALWINFIKQDVFSASTSQAIARSAHWLFSLLDNASGLTPNLGANDGALIFPLSVTDFRDYRPTVQAASRAFLKTSLSSGVWDEMSLWFGLPANSRVINSDAYLTENLRGKNSWGYLRASHFKSRLSHMDQLSLDLWWRGINITQDAGTYLYNAEPPWDNPLVTTHIHNTVTVDGNDQMTRAGRFLVLDWANAYSKNIIESEENILSRVRANHRGYHSVKHERTITVYQDEKWVVNDKLTQRSRSSHAYRLHWLLPDYEWKIEEQDSGLGLQIKSPYGWITLQITSDPRISNSEYRMSLVRAGELVYGHRDVQAYEGWVSQTYGQKSPALSFALEVTSPYHTAFKSEFTFPISI